MLFWVYSYVVGVLFGLAFATESLSLNLHVRITSRLIKQEARRQAFTDRSPHIALRLPVSIRFQVLFHSPRRGSFRLSLTVLVHYRSPESIYPWRVVSPVSHQITRVRWYSGCRFEFDRLSVTGLSHSLTPLSSGFT